MLALVCHVKLQHENVITINLKNDLEVFGSPFFNPKIKMQPNRSKDFLVVTEYKVNKFIYHWTSWKLVGLLNYEVH